MSLVYGFLCFGRRWRSIGRYADALIGHTRVVSHLTNIAKTHLLSPVAKLTRVDNTNKK